jgi:hypothetical protein
MIGNAAAARYSRAIVVAVLKRPKAPFDRVGESHWLSPDLVMPLEPVLKASDATIQASMDTYTLISKARPRLGDGQEIRLYDVMEELGDGPVTLDQIVKQCEYRRYRSLLKTEPSIRNSVEWHLGNWLKRGIVKKTPTSSQEK